jgi:hypothetical protein
MSMELWFIRCDLTSQCLLYIIGHALDVCQALNKLLVGRVASSLCSFF